MWCGMTIHICSDTTALCYPMLISYLKRSDPQSNMQTNMEIKANEATGHVKCSLRIQDINVIKLKPRRHRLLRFCDVSLKLFISLFTISIIHFICRRKSGYQINDDTLSKYKCFCVGFLQNRTDWTDRCYILQEHSLMLELDELQTF